MLIKNDGTYTKLRPGFKNVFWLDVLAKTKWVDKRVCDVRCIHNQILNQFEVKATAKFLST